MSNNGSLKRTIIIFTLALFTLLLFVFPEAASSLEDLSTKNSTAIAPLLEAEQLQEQVKEVNVEFVSENETEGIKKLETELTEPEKQAQGPDSKPFHVQFGERPPIDLAKVPYDAMEKGKIYIKLKHQAGLSLENIGLQYSEAGIALTGIEQVDLLNAKYGVIIFESLFAGLYYTKGQSSQHQERHRAWGLHLWYEIEVDTKHDLKLIVQAYNSLDEVEKAEPVYKKKLQWTPDDPQFGNQWHYHNTGQQGGTAGADIDLVRAWDIEKGNPAVIVAIIDDGIKYDHPDLAANMWAERGYNFVKESSTINPGNHGTHVAGTVAAVSNNNTGVAGIAGGSGTGNGVRLMSCQVFDGNSAGGFHQAPVYAADNGAAISQNSWAYRSPGVYEEAVLDAIDYFNAYGGGNVLDGGLTIFAAGNENDNGNWYPGYYSGTMAVAATNNQDRKASYSNYGTWVEISAPGGETNAVEARGILSTITGNNYAYYQGTSMACPHVSGVAALLVSKVPGQLTASNVRAILKESADDHYTVNPDYIGQLGTGRLNAYNALNTNQATPETGSIKVTIEPAAARSAGAQWKLTSGFDTGWKNSGATIADLPAGSYTITFKEVSGWTRPTDISVNITAGTLETRTGTYEEKIEFGSIKVTIEPAAARSAGAQWKLTSGFDTGWKDSADTITDLPAGSYTITFKEVSGWTRPADISVNITAGTLETRTGTYIVSQSFTDVPPDFQFYGYIEAIYAAGITTGYSDGTYRPYVEVSRGQMAAFLARALALDTSNPPSKSSFSDVSPDFQFYDYIEVIYAAGITTGYSDGTYRPYSLISRGQMAAFLARALELDTSNPPAKSSFTDVPPDFQFYGYIEAIYAAGITTGYSDGTYRPNDPVTRGQMAALLARAFDLGD